VNSGERHDAHSTEKWELAAGRTRYEPEHPLHLHVPGFWDEVRFARRKYRKLLCVSFVLQQEGQLIELDPYLSYWYWYPDRIEARYYLVRREGIGYKQQVGVRVFLEEKRYIAADGSLHCELGFDLLKEHPGDLHVVAWGVETTLKSPDGLRPTSKGRATMDGQVVPKLSHTPFMGMLANGKLRNSKAAGVHALSALYWNVDLSTAQPVHLHVAAAPA
jgi:hypothetical protein